MHGPWPTQFSGQVVFVFFYLSLHRDIERIEATSSAQSIDTRTRTSDRVIASFPGPARLSKKEAHGDRWTCNPLTSGTCSAKYEGATRASPDNWKMKVKKNFPRFARTDQRFTPLHTAFGSVQWILAHPISFTVIRPCSACCIL